MKREAATKMLQRILNDIDAGKFPLPVKEVYVFGSYARGALEPGDLDLIVRHEQASQELIDQLKEQAKIVYANNTYLPWHFRTWDSLLKKLKNKALRRPGERLQIFFETSEAIMADRILLWSPEDRNWQVKLDAIKPDPNAKRFDRGHFAPMSKFRGDIDMMEEIMKRLASGELKLTVIDANNLPKKLNATYQRLLDEWIMRKIMGRKSLETLPYAMAWMQSQRGQAGVPPEAPYELWLCSQDWKYKVILGKPSLWSVLDVAGPDPSPNVVVYRDKDGNNVAAPKAPLPPKKICLIPHFKKGEPRAMYVFEKGNKKPATTAVKHPDGGF